MINRPLWIIFFGVLPITLFYCRRTAQPGQPWQVPDTAMIPHTAAGDDIRYGRALIAHTALYLGPQGSVAHISNGMNCQNCHLDAGTKVWGNNYNSTAATFPKFRARSGTIESIEKKVNDCFVRSLNGHALDSNSKELKAIIAYIQWLGKDLPKGYKTPGSGIRELPYLPVAADTGKGKIIFLQQCQRCHGADGSGQREANAAEYRYPPLWGPDSYNTGAGLYRLSRFAGYVKDNMPFGVNYLHPQLSDEDAWNVAAFVNSQPRPVKAFPADWPDIRTKPPDHPFGPYSDTFSEVQHKYGPFRPIVRQHKK
ncbi:c-type cytochrome [Chitinophaga qingshengii]|uniref:C-type cytochrome n=1 Tax=Chitinophaga qingshengii TaxID=1569794 RepID=A0ABR7TM31_9BACT|nr:c-type cytochrome [Chitinophaga qingshengii]MBC9930583.1 c-type cytochrome [Chitinophaga qingshengii]